MKNFEIAWALQELADLLDLSGENPFKTRAYRMAARRIEGLSEDVAKLYTQGRLTEIDGIGEAIAKKVGELLTSGQIGLSQRLKQEIPPGLFEVLAIPGVGPKRAHLFHRELGINSVEELKSAAKKRLLRNLKGLGNKAEAAILAGIRRLEDPESAGRMPLMIAQDYANLLKNRLQRAPEVIQAEIAGSLRRRVETIGDLDLLAATGYPQEVGAFFRSFPEFKEVLADGPTKISVVHRGGFQVDLRMVSPEQFPSALVYFTGSKAHNIRLRQLAKAKGYKLSEYGLEPAGDDLAVKPLTPSSEEELYGFLGLPFIPPEIREDRGEVEAGLDGALPELITLEDIKGDLHLHSNWSDGKASIGEIAKAAAARGYEYIAICDHSQTLKVARGLDHARLERRNEEIDVLNSQGLGIRILKGIEVDILSDRLDFEDPILAGLDLVVASIHSGFNQPLDKIMHRIELAMRNPHVDILAHPTGRLLGRREGYAIDLERVIELAVETGTALEINSFPDRLDLNDLAVRQALEKGATIVIDTDSHHLEHLDYMAYGIGVARRGWAQRPQVLNTRNLTGLLDWLGR